MFTVCQSVSLFTFFVSHAFYCYDYQYVKQFCGNLTRKKNMLNSFSASYTWQTTKTNGIGNIFPVFVSPTAWAIFYWFYNQYRNKTCNVFIFIFPPASLRPPFTFVSAYTPVLLVSVYSPRFLLPGRLLSLLKQLERGWRGKRDEEERGWKHSSPLSYKYDYYEL